MTRDADGLRAALAGRYRIERELGAGGMATVYLAHDEKHDRDVAIKVLHPDLGAALGADRFLAEIRTTARLQHPHILPLLDSGDAGAGLLYYVMPLATGETLRERLTRERQLPVDDAVKIAREVADALGYAHANGIVHRDIKPENILLQGGHALVADFGIALAVQQAGGQRMTQTGLSLGTPQYMSPEQAMGEKAIDARADIYALGAVTYEMLVGEPPFTGATVQAIVAKVLSADPEPPSTIRKTISGHVEGAVLTALAKLPADRFATAAEFVAALTGGGAAPTASGARGRAQHPVAARSRAWGVAGIVAGLLAGLALGWYAWRRGGADRDAAVSRVYLRQPAGETLPGGTSDFVMSPTGETFVYVGPGERGGTTQLWRKERSELHATRLAGTESAYAPWFSPDGRQVAYYAPTGLMRIALAGGAPVVVAPGLVGAGGPGGWLDDGRIIAGPRLELRVFRPEGGTGEVVLRTVQIAGYNPVKVFPLPGKNAILVQACPAACPRSTINVVDIDRKSVRQLIANGRDPVYLPTGHIAYIAPDGSLMAVAFDLSSLSIRGDPMPLVERVASLSLSRNGTLLYREGQAGEAFRPVYVDRKGNATVVDTSWVVHISSFAVSPDGRRAVVSQVNGAQQLLWIKSLPNGPLTRFSEGTVNHFRPQWSRDASVVWFLSGDTAFKVLEKNTNGSGAARELQLTGHQPAEVTATPGSDWLAIRTGGTDTSRTIFGMRWGVDTVPRPLATGMPGGSLGLALSPDGRYLAYAASTGSSVEVYVSPFPDVKAARWQVSASGGVEPRWSRDGREMFYVTLNDELMVAKVQTTPTFALQSTERLFPVGGYAREGGHYAFDQMPDGRFLMMRRETFPGDLVLVEHWFADVQDKLRGRP